jgi:hypothetical protein
MPQPAEGLMARRVDRDGGGALLLLGFALTAWALSSVHLAWLVWKFIPLHCAVFDGMSAPLPLETRIVVAASNRVVRLLPFAVLASPVLLGGLAATMLLAAWRFQWTTRAVGRALVVAALAGASATVAASFAVVHGVQAAYDRAPSVPAFPEK